MYIESHVDFCYITYGTMFIKTNNVMLKIKSMSFYTFSVTLKSNFKEKNIQ